ncbi:hypothetical protein HOP50_11g64080 [Chloropicon primus]|uniref:Myb-like domain-containing protein n=1 Tax=Chloropicon primus TaxID=1764295 RepID=A0A5B8MSW1_9CHLO|nr:hypothetical protein A3770_11p63860 [Chloropicon primus]UPR03081.1 hypothetical protein HOP50_11g64080 [Chloropicon primus]|eukprot:QDZ23868.1 hypothetical protein A3770_11p63860 [Chloropicon primus]
MASILYVQEIKGLLGGAGLHTHAGQFGNPSLEDVCDAVDELRRKIRGEAGERKTQATTTQRSWGSLPPKKRRMFGSNGDAGANRENQEPNRPAPRPAKTSPTVSKWTDEEDDVIIETYKALFSRERKGMWHKIVARLPGRTLHGLKKRWQEAKHRPSSKLGAFQATLGDAISWKWSRKEDERLIAAHKAVGEYHGSWTEIASWFPGRTKKAVKLHWDHALQFNAGSALRAYRLSLLQ